MKSISITEARKQIYNLINQIIMNSEPVQITSRKGDVVVLSLDDWNALQETVHLLSVSGMRESLIDGANEPVEACKTAEEIGWSID